MLKLINENFNGKNGDNYIVIKDFDVQHPELRIYGHRSYNFNDNKVAVYFSKVCSVSSNASLTVPFLNGVK